MYNTKVKLSEKVFEIVKNIPRGKVTTYGIIAKKIKIRDARIIGFILHSNDNPSEIPCHRVVKKDGSLGKGYKFGGPKEQMKKLEKEGIKFKNNKVEEKYIIKI